MGCPSFAILGDYLTFSICTHDPDTGILTDAEALPTYEIYEGEGTVGLLTGSMIKRIAGNAGRYVKKVAITAANGFENKKTYTIEIEATVDGDTGGISYSFAVYNQLGGATAGAVEWTYTLTDANTALPIEGAEIWVTTDEDGDNVVASGTTDNFGIVTFYLDAGDYYVWRKRAGYNFDNPDVETVS